MKLILTTLAAICIICTVKGQQKHAIQPDKRDHINIRLGNGPTICHIDTVSGTLIYEGSYSTAATITEGYYIAPCGGYRIGPFHKSDPPVFIPAIIIVNNRIGNRKIHVNSYRRDANIGYFVDDHYKKIPTQAVYGLIVSKKLKAF